MKTSTTVLSLVGLLLSLAPSATAQYDSHWPSYTCEPILDISFGNPDTPPVRYDEKGYRQTPPMTNCALKGKPANLNYPNFSEVALTRNSTLLRVHDDVMCLQRCLAYNHFEAPCLRKDNCDPYSQRYPCLSYGYKAELYHGEPNCILYPDKLEYYGGVYPTRDPRENSENHPSFVYTDVDCWDCKKDK